MKRKCIVGERKDFDQNIGKSNKQEHVFTCIFFSVMNIFKSHLRDGSRELLGGVQVRNDGRFHRGQLL